MIIAYSTNIYIYIYRRKMNDKTHTHTEEENLAKQCECMWIILNARAYTQSKNDDNIV